MARLLLIEDDRETADELRAELGDRGFDVDWAANGIEGLDKARSGDAEAMIIDRLLPGMDDLTIIEPCGTRNARRSWSRARSARWTIACAGCPQEATTI